MESRQQQNRKPYFERLQASFGAWFRFLERPKIAVRTTACLLLVHTGLLAYSAYVHSPTLNEPGHLVAGLSHWKFGRFELYRVNPPLTRMVAALPVMAVGYEEDWTGFHEGPGARPVFGMGEDFIAANGERSFSLFMLARWACIPFSWLGGIICYLWARDLAGKPAGVMACALWCFSPNILAHASLITADVTGTALGVAACYTFWRWLRKPTWLQAVLTGGVLGLAELSKTTLVLLYPLWPLLWIVYRWKDRQSMCKQDWLREAGMLLLRMTIGLYVLNLGYGFEGSFKPLKEFHFVSNLFTGNSSSEATTPSSTHNSQPVTRNPNNRFANTLLGPIPVPFPKNYLLGIDIQQRDFESYGRPSYLRGQWQDHGWWYYYLYAAAIKVPLGTWGLLALVLYCRIRSRWSKNNSAEKSTASTPTLGWRDELILIFPGLLIFTVVSSKTGFSEHFRYVLPIFPFAFIWIGSFCLSAIKTMSKGRRLVLCADGLDLKHQENSDVFVDTLGFNGTNGLSVIGRVQRLLVRFAVLVVLFWSATSSLWIYPHSLSYFNESIGGPLNGAEHLLGSNVDWGQDLRYLKWRRGAQRGSFYDEPFHLAYYGALGPAELGLVSTLFWPPGQQDADLKVAAPQVAEPNPGYYAISVNLLYGFPWDASDGQAGKALLQQPILKYFRDLRPYGQAGHSIIIFHTPEQPSYKQKQS